MTGYRKYLRNQSLPGMSEMETDMMKGLPIPPIEKPYPEDATWVDLPSHEDCRSISRTSAVDAIASRQSRRLFTDEALSLRELAFLLWATQGVRGLIRDGLVTLRTVPSGGGMHPFETYVCARRVDGLSQGVYRYLAIEHKLLPLGGDGFDLPRRLVAASNGQPHVGKAAAVFVWTARPYRTEYRYGEDSLKDILISVGHICQNLYLACEAVGLGTCATVAYQQDLLDELLGVDGYDEIPLYLAPVGRVGADAGSPD
jgi:SagB-type dehydrogenase family enzyme